MSLLYCYYGDDFTGSTDVLEQLAVNGIASVLFLAPPTASQLARFSACQAIGIAGDARSRDPQWMSAHLPAIFTRMCELQPAIAHYKVCSTFDSAPHRGSIGRALEIGRDVFATNAVPIAVSAPHLGRFLLFGHLFAAAGNQVHRIDRHPTMAHHPSTPMLEADLRRHLAAQTNLPLGLVDLRAFQSGQAAKEFRMQANAGAAAILLDGVDDAMLHQAGQLMWDCAAAAQPLFTIGSSGLTAALIAYWKTAGLIATEAPAFPAPPCDQILVLSGSCSAITAGQIQWAQREGYACIELNAAQLATGTAEAVDAALHQALPWIQSGRDTVLYTALGAPTGTTHDHQLGIALGRLLKQLLQQTNVRRVVLCGGDTSSHAVQQLNLSALTFAGTLAPGVPLCRAHSEPPTALDGLELVLKGGQLGPENFFALARHGAPKQ